VVVLPAHHHLNDVMQLLHRGFRRHFKSSVN
jgi:hypothetical protein